MMRFFLKFAIAEILIALPPAIMANTDSTGWLAPKFWVIYFFFLVVTFLVCVPVLWGQKKTGKMGGQLFLAATAVKLLICMALALVYIRTIRVSDVVFIASFFYLYFLNTVFEIYVLLSNLRHQIRK